MLFMYQQNIRIIWNVQFKFIYNNKRLIRDFSIVVAVL